MANLSDNLGYVPVVRIETSDVALGGNETNQPNKALKELASRDAAILELLGGTDTTAQATAQQFTQLGVAATAQGRLTLSAGTPVPSTNITAATTVYYTPYNGDYIAIYDTSNSRWDLRQFTERSLSLSGFTANTNYDIFAYWNGTEIVLEAVAWATSTGGLSTRDSAISQINGIFVKSADNRRLLGTIRTTGTTGQSEQSRTKLYVSNINNRVPYTLLNRLDSVGVYTYTTAAWRFVNGVTTWRVEIVSCQSQNIDVSSAQIVNGASPQQSTGIGRNSNTANSADIYTNSLYNTPTSVSAHLITASGTYFVVPGYNFFQMLEWGDPSIGTSTFIGSYLGGSFTEDVGFSGIRANVEY